MIKVVDCIDEIVARCFSDQELVDILEFTIGGTKVTVKDQFLFHYETACYLGSKDSLFRGLLYKTHLQQDIILKLQDYRRNLMKILELGEYSKVKLGYKEQLGTETTVGVSAGQSTHDTKQADNYSGHDSNTNVNISDTRTGASETNRVEELKTVIPQPTMGSVPTNTTVRKYDLQNREVIEERENSTTPQLNDPQYDESEEKIGYQHLSKDLTTNQSIDTNVTNTSRGSSSVSDGTNKTARTSVKGNKSDAHDKTVEFRTNDARVRL